MILGATAPEQCAGNRAKSSATNANIDRRFSGRYRRDNALQVDGLDCTDHLVLPRVAHDARLHAVSEFVGNRTVRPVRRRPTNHVGSVRVVCTCASPVHCRIPCTWCGPGACLAPSTTRVGSPRTGLSLVETRGIEPLTSTLQR